MDEGKIIGATLSTACVRRPSLRFVSLYRVGLATTILLGAPLVGLAVQVVVPSPAVICESCHGAKSEGLSSLNAPRLAGLPAWYTDKQLKNFKGGLRGGAGADEPAVTMARIAKSLTTDADIKAVADYFSAMAQSEGTRTSASHDSIERGKALFQQCAACHGADAGGSSAIQAPPLKGANDWYVVHQLKAFREGKRGSDSRDTSGQSMRAIAQTIPNEAAIVDLAAYIGSLR